MSKRKPVGDTVLDALVEFADLEIDGATYKLCYDFNAIAEAEKVADCHLLQGIAAVLLNGVSAAQLRGLLYAAIRKAHPKMTLWDCGRLIRIDTLADIRQALLEAYNHSLPEKGKILRDPSEGADGAPENPSPTANSGS